MGRASPRSLLISELTVRFKFATFSAPWKREVQDQPRPKLEGGIHLWEIGAV
jgi:hypothetical protein